MEKTRMPAARTESPYDRLKMLDSIIRGKRRHRNRQELLNALNRCLDSPIKLNSLDKDIRAIREHLECRPEGVRLIRDSDGYRYDSEEDFTLFEESVNPKEIGILGLLFETLISRYPELFSETMETMVKVASGCSPLEVRKVLEAAQRRNQRLFRGRREPGIVKHLNDCRHSRKAVRTSVTLPSDKNLELVVSPLDLIPLPDECWLACTVHSEGGRYKLKVLPVPWIDDTYHTEERYRPLENYMEMLEKDFDAHILTHENRMDDVGMTMH